jgi:hypothetical protein
MGRNPAGMKCFAVRERMLHGSVSILKFNVLYTPRVLALRAVLFGTAIWRSSWICAKVGFHISH